MRAESRKVKIMRMGERAHEVAMAGRNKYQSHCSQTTNTAERKRAK
jgi:hypothetical protein